MEEKGLDADVAEWAFRSFRRFLSAGKKVENLDAVGMDSVPV